MLWLICGSDNERSCDIRSLGSRGLRAGTTFLIYCLMSAQFRTTFMRVAISPLCAGKLVTRFSTLTNWIATGADNTGITGGSERNRVRLSARSPSSRPLSLPPFPTLPPMPKTQTQKMDSRPDVDTACAGFLPPSAATRADVRGVRASPVRIGLGLGNGICSGSERLKHKS